MKSPSQGPGSQDVTLPYPIKTGKGSVTWELINSDEVKITDQTGDSMTVSISEID